MSSSGTTTNTAIQTIYGMAGVLVFIVSVLLILLGKVGIVDLVILRRIGTVVAEQARILALLHNVDVVGVEDDADDLAHLVVVRGLNQPLVAFEIHDGIIVHALEGHGGHRAHQATLVRR